MRVWKKINKRIGGQNKQKAQRKKIKTDTAKVVGKFSEQRKEVLMKKGL